MPKAVQAHRRPQVAYLLRCLDSDEELVIFIWHSSKEIAAALRQDGVSEYHIQKIKSLIKQGDGKGHKAKPWQEIREILLKYR